METQRKIDMEFAHWLLNEEIYQNKTAVVYHRTKSLSNIEGIIRNRFVPSWTGIHGQGLYTTYLLKDQFIHQMGESYGDYIISFKVNNLDRYLVLDTKEAKKIHGANWKLSSQIPRLSKSLAEEIKYSKEITFKELNRMQRSKEESKNLMDLLFYEFKFDRLGIYGVIYQGLIAEDTEGSCLLKYGSIREGEDFILLRYAYAPVSQGMKNIEWLNATSLTSLRTHSRYKSKFTDKDFSVDSKLLFHKILRDSNDVAKSIAGMNERQISFAINSFTEEEISGFFWRSKDDQGAIRLITKYYNKEFNLDHVWAIMSRFSNLNELNLKPKDWAKLNFLNEEQTYDLLRYAKDREGVIGLFKKYKTNLTEEEKDFISNADYFFR